MQWLTAVLAFATTMLIFAAVVTAIVETIHRIFGNRPLGLRVMLGHYYDEVLKKHLTSNVKLAKEDFIRMMSLARTPINRSGATKDNVATDNKKERENFNKLTRYSFKLLSHLPTETFMERLGSSAFGDIAKQGGEGEQLLKDLAQKFETFGHESSLHFESRARLISVSVAIFVAWMFYVQPYDLIQTYMKNPAVAANIAKLADEPLQEYNSLVAKAEKLDAAKTRTDPVTSQDIDKLIAEVKTELTDARSQFDKLAQAGAPLGWPKCAADDYSRKPDDVCGALKLGSWATINYPFSPRDTFWLLMGGLLIGLGSPFWARLISQLTLARNASKNIANILKPQGDTLSTESVTVAKADDIPVTSRAFTAAASARKQVKPAAN